MRTITILLAALLAGCAHGRPAFLLELNGRKVEFEKFEGGKVPRGLEVSHFERERIQVEGEKAIEVNGLSVYCDGDDIVIGGRKLCVDRDARVYVCKDGEIQVQVPKAAEAAPAPAAPKDKR
jgi:hypothetical protein